ncbi:MAG: MBL fold metallo-hydrolase [Ketobacteraceae bacterium]|nr:MBL fold metallo-hydrolase [Ketobacteraceae bacterium]
MRFASIGSGSEGNGTLVESGESRLLVDCGFSAREAVRRLVQLDLEPESLSAILVTHAHADHIKGVALLAEKFNVPVYMTWGTALSRAHEKRPVSAGLLRIISPHEPLAIGDLQVEPVPVPHDCREPVQFTFHADGKKLGVLSDAGTVTPHMRHAYQACDALLLECNHDLDMLENGPYPPSLKRRVAGRYGHLNNEQAAELLAAVHWEGLRHLVMTHLSQKNNHPEKARDALVAAIACDEHWIKAASQTEGIDWHEI